MGPCKTSNVFIFSVINTSDLKFCPRSYSSCVYRMMRFRGSNENICKMMTSHFRTLFPCSLPRFQITWPALRISLLFFFLLSCCMMWQIAVFSSCFMWFQFPGLRCYARYCANQFEAKQLLDKKIKNDVNVKDFLQASPSLDDSIIWLQLAECYTSGQEKPILFLMQLLFLFGASRFRFIHLFQ